MVYQIHNWMTEDDKRFIDDVNWLNYRIERVIPILEDLGHTLILAVHPITTPDSKILILVPFEDDSKKTSRERLNIGVSLLREEEVRYFDVLLLPIHTKKAEFFGKIIDWKEFEPIIEEIDLRFNPLWFEFAKVRAGKEEIYPYYRKEEFPSIKTLASLAYNVGLGAYGFSEAEISEKAIGETIQKIEEDRAAWAETILTPEEHQRYLASL